MRRTGNLNSADEWTTASKPTNAHGTMAKMRSTCAPGEFPGANAGPMAAKEPPPRQTAAKKQTATAATNRPASSALREAARRLRNRHAPPQSRIAAMQSATSPK